MEREKEKREAARRKRAEEEERRAELFAAARQGDVEGVKRALVEGCVVGEREKERGQAGPSLLHACVSWGLGGKEEEREGRLEVRLCSCQNVCVCMGL